jgi:hypothetical protein
MKRRLLLVVVFAVAAAGTAAVAASGDGGPSPGVAQGWDGVVAPDGSVRYVALPAKRSTAVAAVRVRGGRVVRFGSVRGSWGVPFVTWNGTTGGLSADGRALVLAQAARPGFGSASRFLLLDTRRLRPSATVTLRGAFSFDALSADARTLYLIEHVSAQDSSRYRVRAYDLAQGRLIRQAIVDKREGTSVMRGVPVARSSTSDGRWVYTLYASGHHPFVHALDTVGRRAVCIDLPWRGKQNVLWQTHLTLSRDDRRLVLRRRADGSTMMTIDTTTFRVVTA